MNILLRMIALVGMILVVSLPAEAVNVKIVGGRVSSEPETAPTGFCAGTITMTDGGTVATGIDLNAAVSFKAGSLENSYEGVGYLYGNNGKFGGVTDIRVVNFDLGQTPTVVTGNVSVSLSNNPDLVNAIQATVYDSSSGGHGFTAFGTKQVAPCVAGLTNCLHTRTYQNTTTGVDLTDTSILTASAFYEAHLPSNFDNFWVAFTSGAGSAIIKLSTSFAEVGRIAVTTNSYSGLTSDGTYIYGVVDIAGVQTLRRIHRTTLAITDFGTPLGVLSGAMAHVNGFLYISQSGQIIRVRTSDMTKTGTLALGVGDSALRTGVAYDAVNARLYVTNRNFASVQIQRINLTTFTVEQTLGRAYGANQVYAVGYDFPKKHIWIAAAENSATLMKTNLCS